ncbi:uncharacterized protein ACA1_358670 [Acanthamoeba castellanii str. Neff]|uniref:Hemerythrin-like domain-containing protein n=1 Tax=Acanthamoeba castellanii (strain ATCC 30010 / Neff) TaxID=1257118 RepID=L8GL74_ACACF|nr:uncharacterized protein ACA1_358670 [Acanthamoeba castellanii str. Neff]ELR13569.1 hypothetical protein ACA1_358670 [Acanthamoeba castellanii str. Neff]
MKETAPPGTATHNQQYDQQYDDQNDASMNGSATKNESGEAKNESGNEMRTGGTEAEGGGGGGMEGALGLLFLQQTTPGHPRGDITQAITFRIAELLSAQLVVEEKVLFPVLLACGERGRALVDAARAEHPAMMTGLVALQGTHYTQPSFGPTIEPLIALIAKRSYREEQEIQPCLQQRLAPTDYAELTRLVDRVRELKSSDHNIETSVRALADKLKAT